MSTNALEERKRGSREEKEGEEEERRMKNDRMKPGMLAKRTPTERLHNAVRLRSCPAGRQLEDR